MAISGPALPPSFPPIPREVPRAGPGVKIAYLALLAGLLAAFAFYVVAYSLARGGGSPEPDYPYIEALGSGRDAVYVTEATAANLRILEWTIIGGVPLIVVLGVAAWVYYAFYEFFVTRGAAILRGACPRCLQGPIHAARITMHPSCPACGARYQRENGYMVGALYFSYLFCILLAVPPFLVMLYLEVYDWKWWVLATVVPSILLARGMIRLSRAMFMHLDYLLNPWHD
ncbi:MAG: DUF983 domain-containing protein [Planctomycetota bacterium]|nr:DUF983 domain-containing protein [Planctomycetota bacterium]